MKHSKCKGYMTDGPDGIDGGCNYETTITCDECRYCEGNKGRGKDPAAKCNQEKS